MNNLVPMDARLNRSEYKTLENSSGKGANCRS
ncbi:DNA/RNA non-specific endonuclease [Weizmannia coagulans]|uniref:DNA/RNA non-specific endonuclease n=1 Tax=Heyndrickxia faecalis TaxID=2824910 RepID=A0ABV3NL06_9BACI|nr:MULTISPECIES: DNA/RNA non-specific endonuclease [Heyndrickxia]MEC2223337.1 DNA/RNA non-specific endonuclease [Weizmannia sp. CD-2023]MCR4445886.1 DNA/RNA non-specific endonuclease [Heyndrickxia coagulans]MCW8781588.1 DNA/RNA non-specific endonuclease [Heyndrickxia coagulans]MDL4846293.1 DNA/RNA non-specific endonuclease [Heyndrickxia coagulans]UYT06562.1 DNA/RNA non-specific endonuclease [Weizmannia sp. WK01]